MSITDNIFDSFESYESLEVRGCVTKRCNYFLLLTKSSSWQKIKAGVAQFATLGPLNFLNL